MKERKLKKPLKGEELKRLIREAFITPIVMNSNGNLNNNSKQDLPLNKRQPPMSAKTRRLTDLIRTVDAINSVHEYTTGAGNGMGGPRIPNFKRVNDFDEGGNPTEHLEFATKRDVDGEEYIDDGVFLDKATDLPQLGKEHPFYHPMDFSNGPRQRKHQFVKDLIDDYRSGRIQKQDPRVLSTKPSDQFPEEDYDLTVQ